MKSFRDHRYQLPSVAGAAVIAAVLATGAPATASTTPIASFVPVPYTSNSVPFNTRLDELSSDHSEYTEMEFFVSGNANLYMKDATTGNAVVNTPNHAFTSRILVRLPADPKKFSGNVVMEIYNGTPGYDADVEWTQVKPLLQRHGDAWIGLTNGTGPANVLKNDYAPKHAPGRYDPINFASAGYVWDLISQTGALIKNNATTHLLPGYQVKHLYAMAESGAAQTLVLYINDIHPFWRMPGGGPIFDGFMPDERFGTGSTLAPGVAAWPTCSPRLVLHSDVPIMNVETQPDLLSSQAWCVRCSDSNAMGDRFRSWELPGSPHLTPLVTDDDNSHRDLDGTPFVYSTFTCTHQSQISMFPKEYFKQAALGALYRWVNHNVPPPSAPPIKLVTPTPPALTPVSYVLDGNGNETGGLRTPFVDFPDRQWIVNDTTVTSTGPLGALFCTLYGYTVPFTTDELKSLYKSHEAYVSRVVDETDHLLDERFLQRWNARTIKYNAAASFIPTAHSDDLDRDDNDRRFDRDDHGFDRGRDGDDRRSDHDFDWDDD
jgi:hypothetical protein